MGWRSGGDRCVPNVDDVAAHLRWVADHRGEARELGRRAATGLSGIAMCGTKAAIAAILEDRVDPPRSLRRTDALWVSSLGTECGIAAYTDDLAGALPSTRAIASIDAGEGYCDLTCSITQPLSRRDVGKDNSRGASQRGERCGHRA